MIWTEQFFVESLCEFDTFRVKLKLLDYIVLDCCWGGGHSFAWYGSGEGYVCRVGENHIMTWFSHTCIICGGPPRYQHITFLFSELSLSLTHSHIHIMFPTHYTCVGCPSILLCLWASVFGLSVRPFLENPKSLELFDGNVSDLAPTFTWTQ